MADARHVQLARELEQRDTTIADALATVRALQADVEELREHAQAARAIVERHADARAEVEHALDETRIELHAREEELATAEAELASAREGEPELAARRALTRAGDAATSARQRVARVEHERETLEREHARAEADVPRLRARAAELAARLTATPRATAVPFDEDEIEWTSRARAALFVAAASLETEREQVVREANELAAAALGDPTSATSVSLVRARIEQS
jgi:chromosome segregation ATPase